MKKYCKQCGSLLAERPGRFNEETGENVPDKFCANLKCVIGCGEAGHIFYQQYINQRCFCKRCGINYHRVGIFSKV